MTEEVYFSETLFFKHSKQSMKARELKKFVKTSPRLQSQMSSLKFNNENLLYEIQCQILILRIVVTLSRMNLPLLKITSFFKFQIQQIVSSQIIFTTFLNLLD